LALALALLALVAYLCLPLLGYRATVVTGGSMEPAIPLGSLIIAKRSTPDTLAQGDIISFRRVGATTTVTHRIVAAREENGQRYFATKGDANGTADPGEMSFTTNVYRVVTDVPYAGFVVGFARSPLGLLLLFVAPALALVAFQLSDGSGRKAPGASPQRP
jgi:signal peptidase